MEVSFSDCVVNTTTVVEVLSEDIVLKKRGKCLPHVVNKTMCGGNNVLFWGKGKRWGESYPGLPPPSLPSPYSRGLFLLFNLFS